MPDSPERLVFVEPAFVPDIFAHRLAYTEEVADNLFRFVFAVDQRDNFTGGVEHVICCKLVVPRAFAEANQKAASAAMGRKWVSYRV